MKLIKVLLACTLALTIIIGSTSVLASPNDPDIESLSIVIKFDK